MNLLERLSHARTTAANDDMSEASSEKRQRHIDRVETMAMAADEIERLRTALDWAYAHDMEEFGSDGWVEHTLKEG